MTSFALAAIILKKVNLSPDRKQKLITFDNLWSACHEHGTKKTSESPTEFEPMTTQTPGGRSIQLS